MAVRATIIILSVALIGLAGTGCRTPSRHVKEADRVADQIVSEYQQKALGRTEPFTIEQPALLLKKRLLREQKLIGSSLDAADTATHALPLLPDPLKLSLADALGIGARNSRRYQSAKENVFRTALSLDLERDNFRNSYSGMINALFSGTDSETDGETESSESTQYGASAGITRKLQTGISLSTRLAVDLVKLLTQDGSSSLGILADATISIPLLKGAGKSIAGEPLVRAERDVIYAIWEFENFKSDMTVEIIGAYLTVLQRLEEIKNSEGNYSRVEKTRQRAERLGEAGRLDSIQVDQARQNELRARNQLVSVREAAQASLDNFKVRLGLPVDARIELDMMELRKIANGAVVQDQPEEPSVPSEQRMMETALSQRLDLHITRHRLEDAERLAVIARDNLLPDLRLEGRASLNTSDSRNGTTSSSSSEKYSASLEMKLPWEKTAERNAYRNSLLGLDKARRDLEEKIDDVKSSVRQALRSLSEAREGYRIQEQARQLAETRVKSVDLFQEAGRATIRDTQEAQDALISAQNAAVAALVSRHLAELNLRNDMGILEVNEELRIQESGAGDSTNSPPSTLKGSL